MYDTDEAVAITFTAETVLLHYHTKTTEVTAMGMVMKTFRRSPPRKKAASSKKFLVTERFVFNLQILSHSFFLDTLMGLFLCTNFAKSTAPPNFISSPPHHKIAFGFTRNCNAIVFHCDSLGLKLDTLNLF